MITDIGTLTNKILVFGGPYSNIHATRAVLDKAVELGIPPTHIICTGDITAYCGNPQETSEILFQSGIHIIQGNCDESLAADSDDCACGFGEDTACEIMADKWYSFSKENTDEKFKKWMGTLPYRLEFMFGGKKIHILHGSNDAINEFVFSSNLRANHLTEVDADFVIGGHSGIHFTKIIKGKVWHNAGAIGMPANDGTPRVWYSVITEHKGKIIFKHKALEYDHKMAAQVMKDHNLGMYAETIETGIWPSFDVLPEVEKQQAGIARTEEEIILES